MPNIGDTFNTTLKKAHLEWGSHRHTSTRGIIYGEGYLQIPKPIARKLGIYNNNQAAALTEYLCSSTDGFLNNVYLKACGSSSKGDIYAKQFEGSGDLKLLGTWFSHVDAEEGDVINITWVSPSEIVIKKL